LEQEVDILKLTRALKATQAELDALVHLVTERQRVQCIADETEIMLTAQLKKANEALDDNGARRHNWPTRETPAEYKNRIRSAGADDSLTEIEVDQMLEHSLDEFKERFENQDDDVPETWMSPDSGPDDLEDEIIDPVTFQRVPTNGGGKSNLTDDPADPDGLIDPALKATTEAGPGANLNHPGGGHVNQDGVRHWE
jgi:hypothetical protein